MRRPPESGTAGEHVRFFERAGPGAEAALRRLRDQLARGGAEAELLTSADRDGRWLLVVRGDAPEPPVEAGTRCWRFRRVAP